MSNPKDLRVIKTRRTIRNSLISLLAEKELSEITISELSARAQINRKTFYRHYRSIAEVVMELEDELLSDFSDILKSSRTSIFDIGAVLSEISALISGNQSYFIKLMKLNPELFSGGRVKAMLRRAVEVSLRDICKITSEPTLRALSEFMVSGILSLYSAWFEETAAPGSGLTASLDEITEIARRLITDGLKGFVPDDRLREIL